MAQLKCKNCNEILINTDSKSSMTHLKKKCPHCGTLNEYSLKRNKKSQQ